MKALHTRGTTGAIHHSFPFVLRHRCPYRRYSLLGCRSRSCLSPLSPLTLYSSAFITFLLSRRLPPLVALRLLVDMGTFEFMASPSLCGSAPRKPFQWIPCAYCESLPPAILVASELLSRYGERRRTIDKHGMRQATSECWGMSKVSWLSFRILTCMPLIAQINGPLKYEAC